MLSPARMRESGYRSLPRGKSTPFSEFPGLFHRWIKGCAGARPVLQPCGKPIAAAKAGSQGYGRPCNLVPGFFRRYARRWSPGKPSPGARKTRSPVAKPVPVGPTPLAAPVARKVEIGYSKPEGGFSADNKIQQAGTG